MKIIFLSAANSIHTVRWVNSLSEKGVEVHLISLSNHKERAENKITKKSKIYYLPFRETKGYYLNVFALKKLINKIKPNLINVHYASGYGTLSRIVNFEKTLLNIWGSDVYDFPNESKIKKKILEKNLKSATYIASTSNVMAKEVNKYTDKDIFITPFGVDAKLFFPQNLKKENNKITIGIVKTLEEKYGIEYLLKAFKKVLEKSKKDNFNKEIELAIYGEGELKERLIELSKKFKISSKVRFEGYIDNKKVPEAVNKMDIFCVPSLQESFGVAAVEAMACEIPVISSDADGFTEVMEDEVTGYVVPKKDTDALANRMYELILDENKRKGFGKNGRRRVLELYDWDKNVDNMINIYKQIIDKNRG
ncbi:glycosyltransferase [uncultured Ilyobacter sp.]|uniref:glycosyltransferase n=1 Tax=uncultured Ilyobacter sp. TaxID=544433 RepID=UPI0029C0256B|nr:glycosyltransferase [uncultured Ilyobacter sp.]